MGTKQSFSTKKQAQIVTLNNSKFSEHQIAKKMKASKTVVYNAIIKYQNEGVFIDRKSLYLYVYVSWRSPDVSSSSPESSVIVELACMI